MPGLVLQMLRNLDEESVECCNCGTIFASNIIPYRRKDGKTFYCPNGHPQSWTESEATKLRKQLDAQIAFRQEAERGKEWALACQRKAIAEKLVVENKLRAQTKRVNAGVCPQCQRTFKQLAEHMKCKHKATA